MGESLIILELSEVFAPKIKFQGAEDLEIHCYQYRCLANKILSSGRIFRTRISLSFQPPKIALLYLFIYFSHIHVSILRLLRKMLTSASASCSWSITIFDQEENSR